MSVRTIIISVVAVLLLVVGFAQYEGTAYAAKVKPIVILVVTPGCEWCAKSEQYLTQHHITYTATNSSFGVFPRLWVDSKFIGVGYDAVKNWVDHNDK